MDPLEIIAIVSVATAALFWIVTQWNIVHTKNVLKKFQAEARNDATAKIDAAFVKIETLISEKISAVKIPDLAGIEASIKSELETLRSEIPDLDGIHESIMEAVNGQLTQLGPALTEQIVGTVGQQLKTWEAQKTRQLGQQLSKYGIAIEETGEAIQGEILAKSQEGLSPVHIAALEFLGKKVSPAYAEENPAAAMFLDLAKVQAVKMLQEQGLDMPGSGTKSLKPGRATNTDKSGLYG